MRSRILLLSALFLIAATNVSKGDNGRGDELHLVTLSEKNISLSRLIWKMKQQTGIIFTYNTEDIAGVVIEELDASNEPAYRVLNKCLENSALEYKIVEGAIVIRKKSDGSARLQQQDPVLTVRGHIADEDGEPLIGVTIMVKGTGKGTITDIDGNYTLDGVKAGQAIVVSYVGKESVEKGIVSGQSVINITLRDREDMLGDVVVTGYQTISKERATGAYAILSAKNIENKTETNVLSLIEGLVPGMSNDGESRKTSIRIRGTTSLNADKDPLYIVDGIPYEGDGDVNNPLKFINPNDVANITVLKDAAAASIYGARAANGVIVITTRKGQPGKTKVSYNGSIHFSGVPSLQHLGLIGSQEFVEYERAAFNTVTPSGYLLKNQYLALAKEKKIYIDPVREALIAHDKGEIDEAELNGRLSRYASLDNRDQIYDAFSRTAVTQQHNLGVSGGSDKYRFYLSANYLQDNPHDKYYSSRQYGLNIKNEFTISPRLKAFVNASASFNASNRGNYGTASYSSLLLGYPSYLMLKDNDGNPLPLPNYGSEGSSQKSQYEIDRLISVGLLDQTFYPKDDVDKNIREERTNYLRLQGGVNWEIVDGLSASVIYQQETSNLKWKTHYLQSSYYMRNRINDAAQINPDTKEITYNLPLGGRLNETRADDRTYTLRAQMDFNKTFGEDQDHSIVALAGAERRARRSTSSGMVLLGYSENGMNSVKYDPVALSFVSGTEALSGSYHDYSLGNPISDRENRFVSFYGNVSYSFKSRYDISGSIRVDESDLFARTANNKWKPIWSVGAGWHLEKESFVSDIDLINRLGLRLTYGIGGNIDSSASPFTIIYAMGTDRDSKGNSAYIREPANPQLSWEKTSTVNAGVDFAIIGSRISGSIDYYKKHTVNLYGDKQSDPTVGWPNKMVNYGKMDNQGIEMALNTTNIENRNFGWNTGLIFSFNKNKLVEIEGTEFTRNMYLYENEVLAVGKPLQSIYSPRYAGLNKKGVPQFYNKKDEVVDFQSLDAADLVYAGTSEPKYNISLINTWSYKRFELFFKLVYYGGHVLRDQRQDALLGFESVNFNREALNFWKQPGDELDSSKSPAIDPQNYGNWALGWMTRDTGVKKANYLKLRNVNLTYRVPKAFLDHFKIEQMALSLQADNLLTWTANGHIDPESYYFAGNGRYSITTRPKPSFSLSVNVNF